MTQKLRGDAQDNRDRIVAAARQLFADHGTDVGMREIARQAGVGPATIYRRFPTHQALVDEVFIDELDACRTIVERGQDDPDPWRGLRSVVTELILRNAGNHAFVDAIATTSEGSRTVAEHRRQLIAMLHGLTEQAKSRGQLRDDFSTNDVILALIAARGFGSMEAVRRGVAAHRFASLILDAFRLEPELSAKSR